MTYGAGSFHALRLTPVSSPPEETGPAHDVMKNNDINKKNICFILLYNIRILLCLFLLFTDKSSFILYDAES